MKINEVEKLSGIPKKNIRFYEEEGLLAPKRNSENGYRDYGEEDIAALQRIKFFRKLGVPIEEIRQMLMGTHTVGDGMRRHLITLERERRNVEQSIAFCEGLRQLEIPAAQLDAEVLLSGMEELEKEGTSFQNKQSGDFRVRYAGAIVATVLVLVFVTAMIGILVWAWFTQPEDAPPLWFFAVIIGIFAAIGIGTVAALIQRIEEIQKGEMDDAKKF